MIEVRIVRHDRLGHRWLTECRPRARSREDGRASSWSLACRRPGSPALRDQRRTHRLPDEDVLKAKLEETVPAALEGSVQTGLRIIDHVGPQPRMRSLTLAEVEAGLVVIGTHGHGPIAGTGTRQSRATSSACRAGAQFEVVAARQVEQRLRRSAGCRSWRTSSELGASSFLRSVYLGVGRCWYRPCREPQDARRARDHARSRS